MNSNLFSDIRQYLESLEPNKLKVFLGSPCRDEKYKDLSNAQSLYRKMLENDNYILEDKKDADLLLQDMQVIFGKKIYGEIYAVLKAQQEQKIAMIKSNAPPFLYHRSVREIDKLEPRMNTCQFSLYTGKMVCASVYNKRQLYSVREPYRADGHKATSIVTPPMDTPWGKKEIVLGSRFSKTGYIHKLPSETFIPIVRLDGYFAQEWISFSPVSPVEITPVTLEEIEKTSDYLFFTFPSVKKEEEFLEKIKTHKQNLEKFGYKAVESLVEMGLVIPLTKQKPHLKTLLDNLQDKPTIFPSNGGNGGAEL